MADTVLQSGLAKLRSPEAHRLIGDRFLNSGDFQTAILQYKRALLINPRDRRAAWALGKALAGAGEGEEAKEVLRTASRMDPDYDVSVLDILNPEILLAVGEDEVRRKRYARAEGLFRKALAVRPDLAGAYFGLGEALFRQEKLEEAKTALQKAIFYDPDHYKAYEVLGKIHAGQGDMENATVYVQKSLSVNPRQPRLQKILRLLRKEMRKNRKTR